MAKKSTAWFPFYVDDWHGGTKHLSLEERACYLELLLYQHTHGHIPAEPLVRMNLCGVADIGQWERIWRHLEDKFEVLDDTGRRANPRMADERERAKRVLARKREGGRKTAQQRWGDDSIATSSATSSATKTARHNHNHNHSSLTSTTTTTRASEGGAVVVELGKEELRLVRKWANRVRQAKPSLERDWVWQCLVLAVGIDPGLPADIGEAITSGRVERPRAYAEKILRENLGINTPELRQRLQSIPVPPVPTESPRDGQTANHLDDRSRADAMG